MLDRADLLRALLPRHRQQPVQIVARDRGLGRHRRHRLQLAQLLQGFLDHVLGHSRRLDLLLQLVELRLLAAAQLLLDGLDLLVQVVLFLRLLHLPLDARLDGAVHVQLLDGHIQHIAHARQPRLRVEDIQQLLLLVDRKLQVGRNRVRQLGRLVHAHARRHRLVVQRLLQLHILLEERVNALHRLLHLRSHIELRLARAHGRNKKAVVVAHLDRPRPLHALHQHLDVAVRHAHALHNIAYRAGFIDVVHARLIHRGVVLGRQKDLPVAAQRLLQRAHARHPSHHKRGHHMGEDHHVPDRHHRQLTGLAGQNGLGLVCHGSLHKTCRSLPRMQPADNASQ